ncbi:lipid-A-disaccharide synthase [Flectobacillus sp. DC10W]|uniref:Lipid-A-disaccharide synthase n=1 Tax=Flectobacillus longus TaxID=2984207 RepID=A0ABT6YJT3_9BACT|nr:lipid-A-disaccharide synthase [Flectobacillus longus]MDI9863854.1 lipid-A-disaccharide synthase [Flectobacillus longus]
MKYYIIAGERSGDLHGSNLIKAILQKDANAQIRAWGGDMMQDAGATLVKHYKDIAFMGFAEVIKNLPTILGLLSFCKKDIQAYQPDVVILIDYAGFNMRVAKFVKSIGIKTFYYISPKVWAWNQSRALNIKKFVDRMFVIFPFEKDFFKKYDYEVDYVGNPLFDAIADFQPKPNFRKEARVGQKPIIALLPGSRQQEVAKILPLMVAQAYNFPDYQFVIAGVSNLPKELYARWQSIFPIKVVYDDAYNLLSVADAALVTSGTATLETALLNVPQVVCYKTSGISFAIAKMVIKVPYISLVNLVAQKKIVPELIQSDLNNITVQEELKKILTPEGRQAQLEGYAEVRALLGDKGASAKAGSLMVDYLLK